VACRSAYRQALAAGASEVAPQRSVSDEIAEAIDELSGELKDAGIDLASTFKRMTGGGPKQTPAQRLLKKRDRRRAGWRKHLRTYLVVNGALAVLNLVTGIADGDIYPWAIFPAAVWGIAVALHGLGYRAWSAEKGKAIAAAEEEVAREVELAVDLGADANGSPGLSTWADLIGRCRVAVTRAAEALDDAGEETETRKELEAGLERVERLAKGASRIRKALIDVAPGGSRALDEVVADLDGRVTSVEDERLREVYQANRSLVVARKAKIETLEDEERRMRATAEGFLLAAENLRLDAARLTAGEAPELRALIETPLERLAEEVEIVRKVEAELGSL
jgi:hypothetical protein